MDNPKQSHQDNMIGGSESIGRQKENFLKLRAEYLAAQEIVQEKQRKIESLRPQHEKLDASIFTLIESRDELNALIKEQRKQVREADEAVREAESNLADAQSHLADYETAVGEARKRVDKARRDAKPFFNLWRSVQNELEDAEKELAVAFQRVKAARQEYILAGGQLTSEEKSISSPKFATTDNRANPWLSGTFYLFALVVVIGIIVFLNYLSIPWYTTVAVVIIALFALLIIAALQLRNDSNLSEENFIKLLLEVIKQLPLFRKP
jgi:hypothetical protein